MSPLLDERPEPVVRFKGEALKQPPPTATTPAADSKLQPSTSLSPPRFVILGAGSRGNAYSVAVTNSTDGVIAAVAEPIPFKRRELGRKYIWGEGSPAEGQEFADWRDFVKYEIDRRQRASRGEKVPEGVDGAFICTLDETHVEVITSLAPLGLHVLCEKPLATRLNDNLKIWGALSKAYETKPAVFAIGHVLRYSPHNMLFRKLLLEDEVVGDIISIEHTEPIGWFHFPHSYVRGNWRKESTTAPSLLTKSCHDIDLLFWFLSAPKSLTSPLPPHFPSTITSSGNLAHFKRSRKPTQAGKATNCLSCPHERDCTYSAKKLYLDERLAKGHTKWPVHIVVPEIEDCISTKGQDYAENLLLSRLAEDYDASSTTSEKIAERPWFGRCVYESDNDVCDNQTVTITWDEEPLPAAAQTPGGKTYRGPKTAIFNMVSFTEAVCQRRTRVYGSIGEITADCDANTISVFSFDTGKTTVHTPPIAAEGGHGGGDHGLAGQFVKAVVAVKQGMAVEEAQRSIVGVTVGEAVMSHAAVFAAEEARLQRKVVDWKEWWGREVEGRLAGLKV